MSEGIVRSTPILGGACHCGKLRIRFSTALPHERFTPRACDCSFCQKHGAAYISDPGGQLVIEARGPEPVHRYRQGSESADFLLCRDCGVLVAVVYEEGGTLYGAVNSGCLDERAQLAPAQSASPQRLDPEVKRRRWTELWTPGVEITRAG